MTLSSPPRVPHQRLQAGAQGTAGVGAEQGSRTPSQGPSPSPLLPSSVYLLFLKIFSQHTTQGHSSSIPPPLPKQPSSPSLSLGHTLM